MNTYLTKALLHIEEATYHYNQASKYLEMAVREEHDRLHNTHIANRKIDEGLPTTEVTQGRQSGSKHSRTSICRSETAVECQQAGYKPTRLGDII